MVKLRKKNLPLYAFGAVLTKSRGNSKKSYTHGSIITVKHSLAMLSTIQVLLNQTNSELASLVLPEAVQFIGISGTGSLLAREAARVRLAMTLALSGLALPKLVAPTISSRFTGGKLHVASHNKSAMALCLA